MRRDDILKALKSMLLDWWDKRSPDMTNMARDQLPEGLYTVFRAQGEHVEFCLD